MNDKKQVKESLRRIEDKLDKLLNLFGIGDKVMRSQAELNKMADQKIIDWQIKREKRKKQKPKRKDP